MTFYPGAPDADVAQAVQDAARRGLFSGGHYTAALERLFTGSLGVRHLMPTPSCTAALIMACRLTRVGPGDEVILRCSIFPAAGNAVLLAGATPVLCDIDPATQNLSVSDVERRITPRTRAVIAVHYAAVAADMERVGALCRAHGLSLIEVAAQAVGA